jgi:eukaryotic-like serine/threonine-protein kinase
MGTIRRRRHDYTVYIRKTDGSPAIRLGPGRAIALSPDGKWVLAEDVNTSQYLLYPTGAGEQRQLTHDNIVHNMARWTPDGKSLVFMGFEPGKKARTWIMPAEGGRAQPLTPEGIIGTHVTPDGERLLVRDPAGKYFLYRLHGDAPASPVPQLNASDNPIGWAHNGQTLFVRETAGKAWNLRVVQVNLNTGQREFFKEVEPPDRSGIMGLGPIQITPDGKTYIYGFTRRLSDLYVVEGLR